MDTTHLISIAQVGATAFVGIVAGFITWKMQSKQLDIAKGLQEIARAQHETAATKLRLELFEKRFEVYKEVLSCVDAYLFYTHKTTDEEFKNMRTRWSAACSPAKFLFGESIQLSAISALGEAIMTRVALQDNLERHKNDASDFAETKIEVSENFNELKDAVKRLDKEVKPFLSF